MRKLAIILWLLSTRLGRAQWEVFDPAIMGETIKQVAMTGQQIDLALKQLKQLSTEVERLGNPASINPAGAAAVIESLGAKSLVKTWNDLRGEATASAAFHSDGDGLYRVIGETVTTADGQQTPRDSDEYRKYDAITRAAVALEIVLGNTAVRREKVRDEIKSTTAQLQSATTMAEVAKLQGVLASQNATLSAIDREGDAALKRLLLQIAANNNDTAKQEEARREERIADFKSSTQKLSDFLKPDCSPVQIPDPRNAPQP
jgi:hypothetical protein